MCFNGQEPSREEREGEKGNLSPTLLPCHDLHRIHRSRRIEGMVVLAKMKATTSYQQGIQQNHTTRITHDHTTNSLL